jgi:hypothetical protein
MIRATVDGSQMQAFVGDEKGAGDHRNALLLLAILTGYPDQAAEILRRLIECEHNETWWEFIDSVQMEGAGWAELRLKLQGMRTFIGDAEGCEVFRHYSPRVARYSFQSGRVLLAQQLPNSDD